MKVRNLFFGLALILAGTGWYANRHHWASTRKWEPLDIPVSLAPGHIHTPEFEINTPSTYRIVFVARGGFGHQPGPSDPPEYQYCLPDLGTSWSLSNRGHVVAKSTGQTCGDWLGGFEAGDGRYVLDVDISHDGSQFNSLNPRLAIFQVGGGEEAGGTQVVVAFWGFLVLTTLGTGTIICSALKRRHEALNSILRAWPLTQRGSPLPPTTETGERARGITTRRPITVEYFLGDRRSSVRHPLTNLSSIALIAGITLLWTLTGLFVLESGSLIPKGLPIRLLQRVSAQMTPGMQPLLVRVEIAASGRPRLYVDDQPTGWDDFDVVIQKELSRRPPNWPVYVEGDPAMEWRWAVHTIDRIRGLNAEVILLTSRSASFREQTETGPAAPANALQERRR